MPLSGIARWCSGQRNKKPTMHSRLWILSGEETCQQEFERAKSSETLLRATILYAILSLFMIDL